MERGEWEEGERDDEDNGNASVDVEADEEILREVEARAADCDAVDGVVVVEDTNEDNNDEEEGISNVEKEAPEVVDIAASLSASIPLSHMSVGSS